MSMRRDGALSFVVRVPVALVLQLACFVIDSEALRPQALFRMSQPLSAHSSSI